MRKGSVRPGLARNVICRKTWRVYVERERGRGRPRFDDETALTVSDEALDVDYCESSRVTFEESAQRRPSLLAGSPTFSHVSSIFSHDSFLPSNIWEI